jgi:hypothetical protein
VDNVVYESVSGLFIIVAEITQLWWNYRMCMGNVHR